MLKKRKVKVTKFDLVCMVIGRVMFWATVTAIAVGTVLGVVKGLIYLFLNVWLNISVASRLAILTGLISLIALILYSIYYTKYNIKILDIEGHRVVLRKKLFNVF